MKYRKRPVVIDAFRWTGGHNQDEDPDWIVDAIVRGRAWITDAGSDSVYMMIVTLEGPIRAEQGDYIIRGVHGELYPCKPDIFKETYEAVNDD